MMKCLMLCLFLATIFNIAYSRNVLERSKTCTDWDYDGTKIVAEFTLKCEHCYIRGCTEYNTITTTYPNGETQYTSGSAIVDAGCQHELTCDIR